jgi:hypothetical protein
MRVFTYMSEWVKGIWPSCNPRHIVLFEASLSKPHDKDEIWVDVCEERLSKLRRPSRHSWEVPREFTLAMLQSPKSNLPTEHDSMPALTQWIDYECTVEIRIDPMFDDGVIGFVTRVGTEPRAAVPGFPLLNAPETDKSAGLWPKKKEDWRRKLERWKASKEKRHTLESSYSTGVLFRAAQERFSVSRGMRVAATAIDRAPAAVKPAPAVYMRPDVLEDWERG